MQFTIGIPVRNGEKYLHQAIASAVAQTRQADEILVVDDASTDKSAQIAHSPEWKDRIRYIYNDKPTGFADAFNRVARLAQGDYVVILSCDDLLDRDYLLHVEQALKRFPMVRHCYSGFYYIDENGARRGASPEPHSLEPILLSGKDYSQNYLRGVFYDRPVHRFLGVATDRELLGDECPIRSEAGLIADNDFFIRVGAFTDVVGISQPLVSVRIHSLSVANNLESLPLRLAEDYLFQTRYYNRAAAHLDSGDIQLFHQLAARFINTLFLEGLRTGRKEWILHAVDLRLEFEKEVPGFIASALPLWAESLWAIALHDKRSLSILKAYSTLLRKIIKLTKSVLK